jgi:uncharacterized RmlC-like cupin family protein
MLGVDYKIHIINKGDSTPFVSNPDDLYRFSVNYSGKEITVEEGDSAWWVDGHNAHVVRGPDTVQTKAPVTIIRGYAPRDQQIDIRGGTNLPYINGCSSEQIVSPLRPGDPTMQLLHIPPNAKEQAHHIHATARVVQVLEGRGKSIVGMDGSTEIDLIPGMVVVLDRMVPHHFETQEEPLLVTPIHIWSSTPMEQGHPMFYGTIKT